jgi:hypothetical protein
MPVRTVYTVRYRCGHTEDRDLSNRPADKRAGFAKWLQDKDCTPCWRKANNKPTDWVEDRDEWIATQRKAEAAQLADFERDGRMPELSGSDRQVDFARRTRFQLLRELYTTTVEENGDEATYEQAEEIARRIDRASWWLDQREQALGDPEALLELLAAAAESGDGVTCENPN